LIKNGRVMDGSGNPWLPADVAVLNGRIAAIGKLPNAQATRVITAAVDAGKLSGATPGKVLVR
jgi:N-acyl-D-amino-acid deacylase